MLASIFTLGGNELVFYQPSSFAKLHNNSEC